MCEPCNVNQGVYTLEKEAKHKHEEQMTPFSLNVSPRALGLCLNLMYWKTDHIKMNSYEWIPEQLLVTMTQKLIKHIHVITAFSLLSFTQLTL